MSNKVLITGIDGFTGRYLAPELAISGYEVHGTVTHARQIAMPEVAFMHECDLTNPSRIVEVVQAVEPQAVVHLAGVSFVAHGDIEAMYRINLVGTRHLLHALSQSTFRPRAVLIASSANVYGNSTEGVMDESTPPAPANDYAVSKLAMEYVARLYADALPIIVARPFNYTGVGQAESFLLPKIVAHIRRSERKIELGNLDVARDFSDVRMVVQAYARLLGTPAAVGSTFNVCSGKAYTLNEVLDLAHSVSGRRLEVRVNPAFVRPNEVKMLLGSRARLEACIGRLDPFELRDTLHWMLNA
ncbi:MAG TPA: GDP-mannose 4,6-dehydratase [Albitalea sp.]|uniref:GDP-mannose 4,6-dehydratase n=1 Tax=Piscinibacter sp. TaxID=1903157 RepID=UPI002ED02CB6